MAKVPFNVAARTARLIGRENVSNAEGAIIELVKNTYDADSKVCILLFEMKYRDIPTTIDSQKFATLLKTSNSFNIDLKDCYRITTNKSTYQIRPNLSIDRINLLQKFFFSKNSLILFDNGKGMTADIINKHWMTIGSPYKMQNIRSDSGRIVTGEKGIGRFALDRLGNKCIMWTAPRKGNTAFKWEVKWSDFEKEGAVLADVVADLEEIKNFSYLDHIKQYSSKYPLFNKIQKDYDLTHGTMFKIAELRDSWSADKIEKLFSNLETLTPPIEEEFSIYLQSRDDKNSFGKVSSSICDDFDYKVEATADENQNVSITIHRNEFDFKTIPSELFKTEPMISFPFDRSTFKAGNYTLSRSFQELLPGLDDASEGAFSKIGPFNLTIYFMKNSFGAADKEKFCYKDFYSSKRSKWLSKFAGVKIFRDLFRVRPYGEVGTDAFDWLGLGERHIQSPAGPTHKKGQWRVSPNQIAGSTNISRISNIEFADKSSREGLQENPSFILFQNLILSIITLLEYDRQHVMRALDNLYSSKHKEVENKQRATIIAKRIARAPDSTKEKLTPNEVSLAQAIVSFEKEAEETNREVKLLRVLASTGIVITSFAHELRNIRASLSNRTKDLRTSITDIISTEKLNRLRPEENPLILIEDMRQDDTKIRSWLDFSLESIKKDKRTRKKIDMYQYFVGLERSWKTLLSSKSVKLNLPQHHLGEFTCYYRAFPMDLDAIFVNLIANSIDAFRRKDAPEKREITIDLAEDGDFLGFIYADTGPGLHREITEPNRIFDPFFTTKVDNEGKPTGTGLGLWIVKTTIGEYGGDVMLSKTRPGFKLSFQLPLRKGDGFSDD